MEIVFSSKSLEDRDFFKHSGQVKIQNKITKLFKWYCITSKNRLGKPEQLKYNLSGCWSREISYEHRLIYEFDDKNIYVHSLRGHYTL